jgi:hypothetical protein
MRVCTISNSPYTALSWVSRPGPTLPGVDRAAECTVEEDVDGCTTCADRRRRDPGRAQQAQRTGVDARRSIALALFHYPGPVLDALQPALLSAGRFERRYRLETIRALDNQWRADRVGFRGTPTFFLNGVRLGNEGYSAEGLRAAIDRALDTAK